MMIDIVQLYNENQGCLTPLINSVKHPWNEVRYTNEINLFDAVLFIRITVDVAIEVQFFGSHMTER